MKLNKFVALTSLLLSLSACSHKPRLHPGECYAVVLDGQPALFIKIDSVENGHYKGAALVSGYVAPLEADVKELDALAAQPGTEMVPIDCQTGQRK